MKFFRTKTVFCPTSGDREVIKIKKYYINKASYGDSIIFLPYSSYRNYSTGIVFREIIITYRRYKTNFNGITMNSVLNLKYTYSVLSYLRRIYS